MPIDRKFKATVRDRMARTGESYMQARQALLDGRPEPQQIALGHLGQPSKKGVDTP